MSPSSLRHKKSCSLTMIRGKDPSTLILYSLLKQGITNSHDKYRQENLSAEALHRVSAPFGESQCDIQAL